MCTKGGSIENKQTDLLTDRPDFQNPQAFDYLSSSSKCVVIYFVIAIICDTYAKIMQLCFDSVGVCGGGTIFFLPQVAIAMVWPDSDTYSI